jgi:uncharacterized protein YggU (UPF0235/DUF167 family)
MSDLRIRCKLIPGAGENALGGVHDGEIVARVTAQAEKGKANAALLQLLAREFGVRKSALALLRGRTSRHKVIGAPAEAAERVRVFLEGAG